MPEKRPVSMLPVLVEILTTTQARINNLFDEMVEEVASLSLQLTQHFTLAEPDEKVNPPRRKYTKRRKKAAPAPKAKKFPKHWTKTAEGKRRMSEVMKAKYANGWKPRRNRKSAPEPEETFRVVPAVPEPVEPSESESEA